MTKFSLALAAALLAALASAGPLAAQAAFSALARVLPEQSFSADRGDALTVEIALTQGVPYRVYILDAPRRLVVDFREVSWQGMRPARLTASALVDRAALGQVPGGWSRMVLGLTRPLALKTAEMKSDPAAGTAKLALRLAPVSAGEFAARAGAPPAPPGAPSLPPAAPARTPRDPAAPLVVMLDPGHGGIDTGARAETLKEADLTLTFARELKERLVRTGRFKVFLTRDDDVFVPLETRVSLAHQQRADLFISLHADALAAGRASGATVYTLSDTATDIASQKLAERHNRQDLLVGLDLSAQDDTVALVLMDLARLDTAPRSENLAEALVRGIGDSGTRLSSRPNRGSGFSVLKSPDIPSVLIELGFLSDARDLEDLQSARWRARLAGGIARALVVWADQDAARAQLLRN